MRPKLNVVYKDINKYKLTIAKDRIELKCPCLVVSKTIIDMTNSIIDVCYIPDMKTLRGTFLLDDNEKYYIDMKFDDKQILKTYHEEN